MFFVLNGLALVALVCVLFEEKIEVSKAKVTLTCGCLCWMLLYLSPQFGSAAIGSAFERNLAEIANLWLFLIGAMTFVAYLNKKRLLDSLIRRLMPARLGERSLFFLVGTLCFLFSSLADNITATLVSVAFVLSLNLPQRHLLKFGVLVIFAVNSGGVSLITGDVTTLMIFLDDRVSIADLLFLSLPAYVAVLVLAALLSFDLNETIVVDKRRRDRDNLATERRSSTIRRVDIAIACLFMATIVAAMLLNVGWGVPPVLSFLTGLALMFLVARFFKEDIDTDPILEYIRLVEFETLFFFLGVLMVVGTLHEIGTLARIAVWYQAMSPLVGSYVVGLVSALIDNVPMTAALLRADPVMAPHEWLSLTYAIGVGGSLLAIGSASGIVCMSRLPGLTVMTHAKYLPAILVAYSVGYAGALLVSHWLGGFA